MKTEVIDASATMAYRFLLRTISRVLRHRACRGGFVLGLEVITPYMVVNLILTDTSCETCRDVVRYILIHEKKSRSPLD